MAIVTKTIRGRAYLYRQHSCRVGGKVVTKSTYIGPVDGGRRRKGMLGRIGGTTTTAPRREHIFGSSVNRVGDFGGSQHRKHAGTLTFLGLEAPGNPA